MKKLRSIESPFGKFFSAEAPSRKHRSAESPRRKHHTLAYKRFVERLKRTGTARNPFAVATKIFQAQGKRIYK